MTAPTELPDRLEFIPTGPAPGVNTATVRSDTIHVRWVMPEIFHDIPLHEDDEDEAVRLLEELAEKALPGAEPEDCLKLAVVIALGMDDLLADGAEFAAVCVAAIGEDPCSATVFASLTDSPETQDGDTIAAIASGLRRLGGAEVAEIQLPCGPAVSCIGTREDRISGQLTQSGADLPVPTSYVRVYLPLPNMTTVVMEMSTPTPVGWDTFSTIFGNVVSSIRLFHADGSPLIIESE
ncbi:hypothetical protein [Streptomyces formicae]|uniref:Uncharacterized protein n=1 Tax=Streptomyces formicae TaxID=1616117 RepID=A0A291QDT8_9ACTN|nr:hypothetical protein [Streptomyces formicae]ATL29676.1 hypothetical protein KY5_4658c [Streptomyces formicae]